MQRQGRNPAELASGVLPSVLHAVTGAFSLLGAMLTVAFLTVFMLVFGPGLLQRAWPRRCPTPGPLRARAGQGVQRHGRLPVRLTFICTINAMLTTTMLAMLGMPFFLPLGILSGFSSLVPYAGPITAGGLITLLTLATGGAWKALAVFIYFLLYGQLEGNVLAPLVFRRTVHVNPLLTLWAVLFFGELAGIIGAVVAVPLMATAADHRARAAAHPPRAAGQPRRHAVRGPETLGSRSRSPPAHARTTGCGRTGCPRWSPWGTRRPGRTSPRHPRRPRADSAAR